jgi:hypothetical protein
MEKESLGFTYCQVPIVYQMSTKNEIEMAHSNGDTTTIDGLYLTEDLSYEIFERLGSVEKINVRITKDLLK